MIDIQKLAGYGLIFLGIFIIFSFAWHLVQQVLAIIVGVILVVNGLQKTRKMHHVYRQVYVWKNKFRS